jgi:hypothetical protein
MLANTLWVRAPRVVRFPPHTLRATTMGRMACSAPQFALVDLFRIGCHTPDNRFWFQHNHVLQEGIKPLNKFLYFSSIMARSQGFSGTG